jgi:hypothetical protein
MGTYGSQLYVVLKFGYFGKKIGSTWKYLKCGAGEVWCRSFRQIV